MKLKNKKTQVYLIIILVVAILIGIGYAILTSNLNILGNTTINKNTWDIHLENLSVTDGSVTATTPAAIDSNKTTVNFTVKLTQPGDYYEFTVDEVNAGTIDGMISSIVKTGLTESQAKYLDYTVNYSDGTAVSEKQLLAANQTETIKVRVAFKKDLTASDLPTTDTTLNLSFSLNYIQADDSAVAIRQPICKRAITLHTEICNQTSGIFNNYCDKGGYSTGDTITYGNLGTSGTLTSGDAFDCDVNGDGVYDSETERFYYVSDKDADSSSDYATLIYYNNVSAGIPNNTASFAYDSADTARENGPITAKPQLPTTTQWSNVSLLNTTRTIKDETGTEYISFSYEGYAARLLTVQEVNSACGITVGSFTTGELDSCQYLLENTRYTNSSLTYGYWLETPRSSNATIAWSVNSNNRSVDYASASNSNYYGVRPAIEVLKSKISS